jgi:hypothetical protein
MNLSEKGISEIIRWETGGRKYYQKHPEWPGELSGVTIGIGWDLGHTPIQETISAWSHKLGLSTFTALSAVAGIWGEDAKAILEKVEHLVIPWEAAFDVFSQHTLPNWYLKTLRIYPQIIDLHGDCAAALVSLVFNRGTSLAGERRKEMLEIQQLLRKGKLDEVPAQFKAMRRLWPGTEGLRTRRLQEAELFAGGLAMSGE